MKLFGIRIKRVNGLIGYFGIEDWWLSSFSRGERKFIKMSYQPLGSSGDSLTSGKFSFVSQSTVNFLTNLAGWFQKADNRYIACRIITKAEELVKENTPVIDRHFLYQIKLQTYYKDRKNLDYLEKAIVACRQQIELSSPTSRAWKTEYNDELPGHAGYRQLAIILEKQKKFSEAIKICEEALNHGWDGNWQVRIDRCEKKFSKL